MKLVLIQPAAARSRAVNDLLNSPTLDDLIDESEAILYEIECRIRAFNRDKARLIAVKRRVLTTIPFIKPARRRVRAVAPKIRLASKGD